MQPESQDACVALKVAIGRENGKPMSKSDSTDEEVRVRPLDPFGAAPVEADRCVLVIVRRQRMVRKGSQMVFYELEMLGGLHTR